jgi:hypothetical protein
VIDAFPSLDGLRPNSDWAKLPLFDRMGWKRISFGDVVENLNETERNPSAAGIERFIGLEHLEPGCTSVPGATWRHRQDDFIEQIERLCHACKAAQGEVDALGCLAQQLTNTVVGRIEF